MRKMMQRNNQRTKRRPPA
uniref:Uncharacterized protein n=1 Tax=Anguilla anguilla TaxID=7936 RepID=A0A0E9WA52_ANGAN